MNTAKCRLNIANILIYEQADVTMNMLIVQSIVQTETSSYSEALPGQNEKLLKYTDPWYYE